ncbi:MAG TPA: zf-HC2 domain-containing protein [Planctomycetota bacterium]|nr:zf-HC2 domain-containing protein [Planctomycetota bacterium]
MITAIRCSEVKKNATPYIEGLLSEEEAAAIQEHLRGCPSCVSMVERASAVHTMLVVADDQPFTSFLPDEQQKQSSLAAYISGAPWWGVSVVLHVLVILLAGLISMAIQLPQQDALVTVTEINAVPTIKAQDEEKKQQLPSALHSRHETPPTDPTSKEAMDVVIPPDLLARAELGDHFETINPDRPDTQSAFGNPDAKMFHSERGSDDEAGGGGTGSTGLDDMIGVGGAASPGTGGGWGGGNGTGIGVGNGRGKGSWGNRNGGGRRLMVKKHGGSKATENAVDAALRWLAYHQEIEGHWITSKYWDNNELRHVGCDDATARKLQVAYDPGVSGLATLAFLGAGHTLKVGHYSNNVKRAIAWFLKNQGADGDFTAKYHPCHAGAMTYGHCIATLACAEALGMNMGKDWGDGQYSADAKGNRTLRAAVEKGVELILKWQSQQPQGGWSYPVTSPIDPTVTGWAVMALKAAKQAGVNVPADSFAKAEEATKSITTTEAGKGDYGWSTVGYRAKGNNEFGSKGYACTAAGMVINLFLGKDAMDPEVVSKAGVVTQDDALPAWTFTPKDATKDHQNLYYWYYGTLGCFQVGGDAWKKWNKKMIDALVPNQRQDGDAAGSWNPDDCWGAWGGRVYSTALGALCLEVYYRYAQLNGEK